MKKKHKKYLEKRLTELVAQQAPPAAPATRKVSKKRLDAALIAARTSLPSPEPYTIAQPMPGVVPKDVNVNHGLAADFAGWLMNDYMNYNNQFLGYPYLAELSQLPEYRKMTQTRADEMTREWLELTYEGDDEAKSGAAKLKRLNDVLNALDLRGACHKVFSLDAQFGRAHIYLDVGVEPDNNEELTTPLFLSNKKIRRNSLKAFRVIEPMWTYPGRYNANDPLRDDFYQPSSWYVMSREIASSRLVTFVSHPVPDMLKPAYSFGGVSLNQMAKPYVENWIRTRQSVSDLLHCYSTSGLSTDLGAYLSDPLDGETAAEAINRMNLFNVTRDNKGLMVIDKETEEFFQFNTPLAGLSDLQAQSQEHMAAVCSIPLVKLLGITPTGLNASTDGEVRTFYDFIMSNLEHHRDEIKYCIDVAQLSVFGAVDPKIGFKFLPLYQESPLELAQARKVDAETDATLIQASVLAPEESRNRLAHDAESPYAGLKVNDVPEFDDEDETEDSEDSSADERGAEDA